ncbi:MAG TPA: ATP-binding protein [Desulfatiglandales bacterium]|nr:ATP-binding protein [Desulfatiglandales bacterium]
MKRKQKKLILKDLYKKMVVLTGPRQVGKTWLAKDIAGSFSDSVYLNYDSLEDRKIIKKEAWLTKTRLLILDEIHKMPGWKNHLKGIYDTKPDHMTILVTGSARLEVLRQSGDSLAGRYFTHRLLPFSPSEAGSIPIAVDLERFMNRGGFPEPFLAEDDKDADRWRMQYIDGLIRTDILDFERIHDLRAIQLVLRLLRSKVSSPISYKSISEDVGISINTVRKYMQILEALYIIFRVPPFSGNIARSIVKEPKIYFFDTGMVEGDEGIRFENMVALCLLKYVYGMADYDGKPYSLNYLRTKDGMEVDFCLVNGETPELMIEAKRSDPVPGRSILYFNKRYEIPGLQAVLHLKQEKIEKGIEIRRGADYLKSLKY